jgi:hypothetical protein
VNLRNGDIEHTEAPPMLHPQPHSLDTPKIPEKEQIVSTTDSQKFNQEVLNKLVATMQERTARAQAQAIEMLPAIACSSMSIPPLPEGEVSRQPQALPVPTPGVLSQGSEARAASVPASAAANLARPTGNNVIGSNETISERIAPQPHFRSQSYAAAPAPIAIQTHEDTKMPTPVEIRRTPHTDAVPMPVRASGSSISDIHVTPSVAKTEPVHSEAAREEQTPVARSSAPFFSGKAEHNERQEGNPNDESARSSARGVYLKNGAPLRTGVQTMAESQVQHPSETYPSAAMVGVRADGSYYRMSGSAEQNMQALQAGAERNTRRSNAGGVPHDGGVGYLTGSGTLDNYNSFQVNPGELSAGVENGHRVRIDIHNYQTGNLTGRAFGRIIGNPDTNNRTLVIESPRQWTGRRFPLERHGSS